MITKIPPRVRNVFFLVRYVSQKQGAREIDTNLLPGTPREQADQMEELAKMHRPRMERIGKHMILSFPPGEERPVSELRSMVTFYRREMGYADAPFVAYFHTDTQHPHIHIVTTPVTFDGRAVSESWDWPRSEQAARAMEKRWKLQMVPSSETARRRAPTSEEVHQEARTGKRSDRELFRSEIEEVARQVGSLQEATEALSARGYEVHLRRDRHGVLRGLSFERDGVQFRASQLGRAFSGNRFLSTFSLADSLADAAPGTPAPASALLSPVERSVGMSPPTLALPPGRYDLAVVHPKQITGPEQRIPKGEATNIRQSLPHEALEKALPRLQRAPARAVPIVRPASSAGRFLGFRDVDRHQLTAMRRDGYEPHLLVQHGERFDLLLKTHESVPREELFYLRNDLQDLYRLPAQRGVFIDAIRAPAPGGGQAENLPRLMEVRDEPFSASPRHLQRIREIGLQSEVALEAEASFPDPQEVIPALLPQKLGSPLEEPLRHSALDTWEAALQSRIEHDPGGWVFAGLWDTELYSAAASANRKMLEALWGGHGEDLMLGKPGSALLGFESELHRRTVTAAEELRVLEDRLAQGTADLERAGEALGKAPSMDEIRSWQNAARELGDLQARHNRAEMKYAQLEAGRSSLRLDRRGAALAEDPSSHQRTGYSRAVERQLDLDLRMRPGRLAPRVGGNAPLTQLDWHLKAVSAGEKVCWQAVREIGPEALPAYRQALTERFLTERFLRRAQLRVEQASLHSPDGPGVDVQKHRASVARLSVAEEDLAPGCWPHRTGIQAAAERISKGDFSPAALRRLNVAILAKHPDIRPTFPTMRDDLPEGSYRSARIALTRDAQKLAAGESLSPQQAEELFQRVGRALAVHRLLDAKQRTFLNITDPAKPPSGVHHAAWESGWLQVAAKKGLSPHEAVSHLVNARAVPTGLGLVGGMGTSLAFRVGQRALSFAIRHTQEVLKR